MSNTEQTTADLLSRAVIAHLGKGRSPFPISDDEAVLQLTPDAGPDLLERVQRLEDEMMSIQIDWSARSLSGGGDEAARLLSARHPELSDDAVGALRWMFTYNWR